MQGRKGKPSCAIRVSSRLVHHYSVLLGTRRTREPTSRRLAVPVFRCRDSLAHTSSKSNQCENERSRAQIQRSTTLPQPRSLSRHGLPVPARRITAPGLSEPPRQGPQSVAPWCVRGTSATSNWKPKWPEQPAQHRQCTLLPLVPGRYVPLCVVV